MMHEKEKFEKYCESVKTSETSLKEAQAEASGILSRFVKTIEEILIESIKQLIESQFRLEFFNDNTTNPNVYKDWKKIECDKFEEFSLNGYYIIEKFHNQIETKLKQQFPTLVYKCEKLAGWAIVLENFIDPKPILLMAGMEDDDYLSKNTCKPAVDYSISL